jgi:hypothetical protein
LPHQLFLPIIVLIFACPLAVLALILRRREGRARGGYGGPYDGPATIPVYTPPSHSLGGVGQAVSGGSGLGEEVWRQNDADDVERGSEC